MERDDSEIAAPTEQNVETPEAPRQAKTPPPEPTETPPPEPNTAKTSNHKDKKEPVGTSISVQKKAGWN